MDKETGFPEPGDVLTIKNTHVTLSGYVTREPGDKVVVESTEVAEGHPYRPIPDIWIKPKLLVVRIVGGEGFYPESFVELQHIKPKP